MVPSRQQYREMGLSNTLTHPLEKSTVKNRG